MRAKEIKCALGDICFPVSGKNDSYIFQILVKTALNFSNSPAKPCCPN